MIGKAIMDTLRVLPQAGKLQTKSIGELEYPGNGSDDVATTSYIVESITEGEKTQKIADLRGFIRIETEVVLQDVPPSLPVAQHSALKGFSLRELHQRRRYVMHSQTCRLVITAMIRTFFHRYPATMALGTSRMLLSG